MACRPVGAADCKASALLDTRTEQAQVFHGPATGRQLHDIATGVQAVLVVDTSLKMSVGKTAAQCAHAAVGVFKNMHINAVPWLQSWEVSCTFSVFVAPH